MKVSDWTIATLGSHSALQILKGAKDEGFKTLVICLKGKEKPYQMFKVADRIILIDSYQDLIKIDQQLAKTKTVLIPHASLIAYLGEDKVEQLKMKYFGNKLILRHESDRNLERAWLKKAGIKLPKFFKTPAEIDRPTIVKFHGAQGGRNYFLTSSTKDFAKKIKPFKGQAYYLQEYIIGAPIYAHYFYSPLTKELEIFGFDKRYESNVDAIGRISVQDQLDLKSLQTSYTICGNIPVVIRESFLPLMIDYGQAVVDVSKKIVSPGLFGPFCLEMIIAPDSQIYAFEISARIVAGTNPFVAGSPYTYFNYDEPMSTGRRIAREIKNGLKSDKLNLLI
ncbi:formate--phosphoribosylaminoimidazolecarboxamide ligase [Patescibacteria group bacterium]|nr:formate--phosphoribosylaminoimidazolecarboxamide ligase [Patescibacteria group bacterium]